MLEKDPNTWNLSHLFPWLSTLGISLAATAAQYAQKVRSGEPKAYGQPANWYADDVYQRAAVMAGFDPESKLLTQSRTAARGATLSEDKARIAALENEVLELRNAADALREPVAVLLGMHPDGLKSN